MEKIWDVSMEIRLNTESIGGIKSIISGRILGLSDALA